VSGPPRSGEPIRVICGPTGAGKSAIAMRLAESIPLAVVSADSRQIYRGFDVGTAKPTPAERARVPHHGVDVAEPTERWSAARWAEACEGWLAAARAAGREPVVVGGTGFYLRALAAPLFAEPPLETDRRRALAEALEALPRGELRRWVERLDPPRARLGRTQHLRALEVVLLTGRRVSELHAEGARPPRHRLRYLVVDPGRDTLREWIAARTDAMLAGGWLDEVGTLIERVPDDAPAWQGTGYDALRSYFRGERSLAAARERVVVETRQYAKRQRTWFRHQLAGADVSWLDPRLPDAADRAAAWWGGATVGENPREESRA
jgi:tRNA dimethylallyltransferase